MTYEGTALARPQLKGEADNGIRLTFASSRWTVSRFASRQSSSPSYATQIAMNCT